MRRDLLDILACPIDKAELRLDATATDGGDDDEVLTGTLTCTQCGEAYPITEGIPNLLPPDLRDVMAQASEPSGH